MKNKFQYIFILSLMIITACSKDHELQKSIFIPDPDFPELPQYSEWGYNTFGAYYDREAFISNSNVVPVKVAVTNDTASFIFQGQSGGNYYYETNQMSMKISLAGFIPSNYTELIVLNDSTINLQNPDCRVYITKNNITYAANILSGSLQFKRAQNLLVDKEQTEVILSGYFEFTALINNEPVAISDGRFDVGIGTSNFFNY